MQLGYYIIFYKNYNMLEVSKEFNMTAQIIAMVLFALTMSITPGPVNITTFSSGINYGFKPTMPFVSGATIGFTLLLGFVGLGIGGVVVLFPLIGKILCYAGAIFIAYVGYKITQSKVSVEKSSTDRPLFHHGLIMQWLNVKAWVACVAGVSAFNLSVSYERLLIFCIIYFVVCYASIACWALTGNIITKLLKNEGHINLINKAMGLILVCLGVLLAFSSGKIV